MAGSIVRRRFSLYGFLKNQRYFEPFFILIFLEKGLSFFEIGLLIALRELTINLLEILTGVVADLYGRRRSMIVSFVAYIASFLCFGLARGVAWLALAMVLFGVGEAFRTGTHKAMIFAWLQSQGREKERTAFYGHTRSWSKLGSALSVVIGAAFVLASNRLAPIFLLSIIPYVFGIINFLGYPRMLDGAGAEPRSGRQAAQVARHLSGAMKRVIAHRPLRGLLLESLGFEGFFNASKDYLQPVLKAAAIPLVAALALSDQLAEHQRTAVLVGPVYLGLFLLSALASRRAHRVVDRLGDEDRAARWLWAISLLLWGAMIPAMILSLHGPVIVGFVALYGLQNFFRPILLGRIDRHCPAHQGATVLSVESQAKSLATMIMAPALGAAVDLVRSRELGGEFWPVGVVGAAIAVVFLWGSLSSPRARASGSAECFEEEDR